MEKIGIGESDFKGLRTRDNYYIDKMMYIKDIIDIAENFYHAFVRGMLVGLKDTYYVNSNRKSGYGRYDIMLEPKNETVL